MGMFLCFLAMIAIFILFAIWQTKIYHKKIDVLKCEASLLKNANEYSDDAIVIFSKNNEVYFANKAARKLLQLEIHYRHKPLPKEIILQTGNSYAQTIFEMIEKQNKITAETIHVENIALTVGDTTHSVNIYIDKSEESKDLIVCVIQDINIKAKEDFERKNKEKIDELTELSGYSKAYEDINKFILASQKQPGPFALYLFSIDRFDIIRSTYGHIGADKILQKFAHILQGYVSTQNLAYRFDGENFILVYQGIKDRVEAIRIGEETIAEIIGLINSDSNINARVEASVGIVLFPEHGHNFNDLIDRAFNALEYAREKGEGSICIFTNDKQKKEQQTDAIKISEIRTGLAHKEFILHYQPIIDLATGSVVGAEALVRWKHPRLGLIKPDKFISLATRSGLIMEIGDFVLHEAIRQRKIWSKFDFRDIWISINFSSRELNMSHFAIKLEELFNIHQIDPGFFNLEISEIDVTNDIEKANVEFAILKKIGISLSLDRFGIGGSSIKDLHGLPVSMLKVDRSILGYIDTSKDHQEMIKAINALGHTLGMTVLAEGIETKSQLDAVKQLGCDFAQGYYPGKPLDAFEFQVLIRS